MNGVKKIEMNAIYHCNNLKNIYIPKSVNEISDQFQNVATSFGETIEKPTIYCFSDSYAEKYAQNHNYKYVIIED